MSLSCTDCLRVARKTLELIRAEDLLDLNCYASLYIRSLVVKGKGLPVKCHAGTGKGSRGIALLILNLGARWCGRVNATPRLIHSREAALVPIVQAAEWALGPV